MGLPVIVWIHLISLIPCSAFSVWVLKHLVTLIMRSLLWHVCCSFSPFMWIRVYLTCVYVSQVWCASRVSEFALQLQGKPAPVPFRLLTRLFLHIEYPDYLPDMACMYTVLFPNALEGNISYVGNGWCEYLEWFETETRVFIGDSGDGIEWEVLITFRKPDFLGYRRW